MGSGTHGWNNSDGEPGSVLSISNELSESAPTDVVVSLLVAVVRLGSLILPALRLAFIGLTILVTY
mgnify:CR=1 FL=1